MKPNRIVVLALTLCLAACATATKEQIIARTFAGLQAAEDAFVKGDARRQDAIVEAATSHEQGVAALAAYKAKRDKVAVSFVAAYSAIAVASVDLTDSAITQMVSLAAEVISALRELGLLPSGGTP